MEWQQLNAAEHCFRWW